MIDIYNDSLEHEIKFNILNNEEIDIIFNLMNKYFSLFEEGVDCVTDYYYDTNDFYFFQNHMSYRIRIREGSKRFRINYKFPADTEEYPLFIRREIISKLKKKYLRFENPLGISCTVNKNVEALLNEDKIRFPRIDQKLIVKTVRVRYWVTKKEKDISELKYKESAKRFSFNHVNSSTKDDKKNSLRANSGYFGQGLVCFDFSLFYSPWAPLCVGYGSEFEFELWNGAVCTELLSNVHDLIREISQEGIVSSEKSKYEHYIELLRLQKKK